MNFKEKFDELIDFIEANITKDNTEIMRLIQNQFTFGDPAYLAHAFNYITDLRLKEYIVKRKLLHILKHKRENNCSIEDAVEKYNYSSDTNYMRDFKKHFNTTVSKMTDTEFEQAFSPLKIERILSMKDDEKVKNTYISSEPKLFDLPVSQLKQIKKALALMDFYDLKGNEAETAYQLTKELPYKFDSIFSFCFDYFDHINWINKHYKNVKLKNLAIVCIRADVDACQGLEMLIDIEENCSVDDLLSVPDEVWNLIADDEQKVDYVQYPHLAMYIANKMKELEIPLSEIFEIAEQLQWYEDIDECIEDYKNGKGIFDDCFDRDEDYDILQEIYDEYAEIEATFTKDFLGY